MAVNRRWTCMVCVPHGAVVHEVGLTLVSPWLNGHESVLLANVGG